MDRERMTLTKPIKLPDPTPVESVSPEQSQGFFAELFDAITPRTFLLVMGVLVIQLAFVLSTSALSTIPLPTRFPWWSLHRLRFPGTWRLSSATYTASRFPPPPFRAKRPE